MNQPMHKFYNYADQICNIMLSSNNTGTDTRPDFHDILINSQISEMPMSKLEQEQLTNRLAVDKERQKEEVTINFDDSMWEKEVKQEPQARNSRLTETKNKPGDYVLPATIEEELEKSSRTYNEFFPEKMRQYEMERQARLLNLQTDAILEERDQF